VFLIDGYNLLHALSPGRATPAAREGLVGRLEAFCRRGGYRARVVFDPTGGMRRRETRGELEVWSVAPGRTADEELVLLLGSTPDRTAFTLVSNDRAIAEAARKRGAQVLSCQEFGRLLTEPPAEAEKSDGAPPHEVDHWMREFGLDKDPEDPSPEGP
jgi:predicted RNA-binding protein with PIN domain